MPDAAEHDQQDDLIFPPQDLSAVLELARFLESRPGPNLLVGLDGEQIPLPPRGGPRAPNRG
ncbi:MAG: hypothetical protein ACRD29_13795 [Acidimicrobiales bacterium]